MKLTFTATAARDLFRLREFIRKKNPQAAKKVSYQLRQNVQMLLEQPNLGAPVVGLENFRELVARNYVIRYRIVPNEIVILKVWHERESR